MYSDVMDPNKPRTFRNDAPIDEIVSWCIGYIMIGIGEGKLRSHMFDILDFARGWRVPENPK
jgi:hypothetical protein